MFPDAPAWMKSVLYKEFLSGRHALPILRAWTAALISAACFWLSPLAGAELLPADIHPPAEPPVRPLISEVYASDEDRDKVDDRLTGRLHQAEALAKAAATLEQKAQAQAALNARADVELIFKKQITQPQLDGFRATGGSITHIYKAVSYGWNGKIPLGQVLKLERQMGPDLVLIAEAKPAQLHLDLATRTGRVRPIWAGGLAGNPAGYQGNSNITVAIIDSGVDVSHSDLDGRGVYWHDFTSDQSGTPVDVVEHGSHVAGIALGTGTAGGAAGPYYYSQGGTLSGVPNGSFYPSPIDLPASSVTVTITAKWQGNGSTTLHFAYHSKGSSTGWTSQGSTSGRSPLSLTVTLTGDPNRVYSAALLAAARVKEFVVVTQVSSSSGPSDSFNRFRGVASGCSWAGAKVFANDGSGQSTWINAALDTLVAQRATYNIKVANMSLGIIGDPGLDPTLRQKINTAVNNGMVMVASAGNDGDGTTAAKREVDDPGRAAMALTVAAANDVNALTDYSSQGFSSPSSAPGQQEDYKPDLMAPGGSDFYTSILSVDSNSSDEAGYSDQQPNDYLNIKGTSMASPFAAGCAALVIDALQQQGTNWDFNSSLHPRLVKMLLCATASESNANREDGGSRTDGLVNPSLQRAGAGPSGFPAGKDPFEGYGMMNPDAAIEAIVRTVTPGTLYNATLGSGASDGRAWAGQLPLVAGNSASILLQVPAGADFDLYLYSAVPSAFGTPVLLAAGTQAAMGVSESINYTPTSNSMTLLVVKRVSGSGTFSLSVLGSSPVFSLQPQSQTACPGGTASFTASALGAGTLFYQWQKNGGNLTNSGHYAGVNSTNLTISNVNSNDVAFYACLVTNTQSSATSSIVTLSINDPQPPVITCPSSLLVNADAGQCGKSNVTFSVAVIDNCSVTNLQCVPPSGSTFPVGTNMVACLAIDTSSNVANCSFAIVVKDVEPPQLSCPLALTVDNDPGLCGAVVTYATPAGTDNCSLPNTIQVSGLPSGSLFPIGSTTNTFRATDDSSNTATCSFVVTVVNTEPPHIVCPSDLTVTNDPGQCGAVVNYVAPIGTNNCGPLNTIRVSGLPSGSLFPIGNTTNTFRVTDASTNTATCSFVVTVVNTDPPQIVCPSDLTVTNDPGQCGAIVNYVAPTNNCGPLNTIRVSGLPSGSLFPLGRTTNTFQVTDASTNTATCSFMVTVLDTEPPQIVCPSDLTVTNDPGQCGALVTYAAPAGTDNCSGAATVQIGGLPSGSLFPIGRTTNTFQVTDASTNTATSSFVVTVLDTEPPQIVCPSDITVTNDPGQCGALVTYATPTGIDNCSGTATVQVSGLPSGTPFPIGRTTNTFQVTDASTNTATCNFVVTVLDTEPPQITCPLDLELVADAGECSKSNVTWIVNPIDNCTITNLDCVPPQNSVFSIGTNIVICTALDLGGNSVQCSFQVIVTEPALTLAIVRQGTNVVVSWPAVCGVWQLQETSDPAVWDNSELSPVQNGAQWEVTIAPQPGPRFYRLKKL